MAAAKRRVRWCQGNEEHIETDTSITPRTRGDLADASPTPIGTITPILAMSCEREKQRWLLWTANGIPCTPQKDDE